MDGFVSLLLIRIKTVTIRLHCSEYCNEGNDDDKTIEVQSKLLLIIQRICVILFFWHFISHSLLFHKKPVCPLFMCLYEIVKNCIKSIIDPFLIFGSLWFETIAKWNISWSSLKKLSHNFNLSSMAISLRNEKKENANKKIVVYDNKLSYVR